VREWAKSDKSGGRNKDTKKGRPDMGALEDRSDVLHRDSDDREESQDIKAPPSLSLM
jgi:hypothetical protein